MTREARVRIPETPSGPLDLVYLELGVCYPQAKPFASRAAEPRLGWQCLALEVDEVERALDTLKEKGVEAVWGPVTRPQYARAEIRDSDGNPIELRQWFRGKPE